MSKPSSEEAIRYIEEFEDRGFIRISDSLKYHLRFGIKNKIIFKIFKPGASTRSGRQGSIKYTSNDIFGDRYVYYYDIKREKDFVDFLVKKFLTKNPDPDKGIRIAFSRILHSNGLHWFGCTCNNRKTYPRKKISMNRKEKNLDILI